MTSRQPDSKDGRPASAAAATTRELEQLCRFAGTLGVTLDVTTIVEDALDPLLDITGAGEALVALADEDERSLSIVARRGRDLGSLDKKLTAASVAAVGAEARAYSRAEDLPSGLSSRLSAVDGPLAIVPLWVHARMLGAVILAREKPFGPATSKVLTTAGRQLALAIENSQLFRDLQQSYRQLMDAQEEVIRTERLAALGQLSATLAHEIRNPLATILSAVSQLRKHAGAGEVTGTLLDIAEEETLRLNQMVRGLLEFARPRNPSLEGTRPLALAHEVVRSFEEAGEVPEGTTLAVDESSADPLAEVDPELTQRALSLLVSNALQALEGAEGRVLIRVVEEPRRDLVFAFEVEDDGCGIAREQLASIREPFFTTQPSGTGLGLPTAERIAEDHGGGMEIDSEVGMGTTVRLLFGRPGSAGGREEKRR
jgi:two-component system, NtrC family, sensor histidine kinase HydH